MTMLWAARTNTVNNRKAEAKRTVGARSQNRHGVVCYYMSPSGGDGDGDGDGDATG